MRLLAPLLLGIATTAAASRAAADEPPAAAAPPPQLVPPRLVESPPVLYPAGASGDASVVVELSVDRDGKVSRAALVRGDEPFASAAVAGVASFRYEPARRGDMVVPSRIRVLIEFHEAKSPPSEAGDASASPEARSVRAAEAPDSVVEEVTVQGTRAEVGRTPMSAADVRQMPGAFGDAFRAIEALPGVTPIVSGLPYYFIRGAPPGNTGYMIDGVRVPLLFHFGVARSVIHPGLIDHVDFYPGGFPARYGRFAGAIIDGQTKAPESRSHGEWDASIIHAGALADVPFGDGRGHVTVAGRYGYPGLLLSLLAPQAFLQYGDYQARVSWDLGKKDTVSAFVFGSYDGVGTRKDGELKDYSTTQFHRMDLRWDRDLGGGGRLRTAVTLGIDRTGSNNGFDVVDVMSGVRSMLDLPLSPGVRLRAGADMVLDRYRIAPSEDDTSLNFPTRNDAATGIYADLVLKPTERVEIVPGLRFDYFEAKSSVLNGSGAVPTVDPRLATRVRLLPRLAWITTAGLSHQPPSFLVPVPGLQLGALRQGTQTAVQMSQGFELGLPLEFTFAPTAFVHEYLNMTDATATCGLGDFQTTSSCLDERVRGRTVGLELFLRRPLTKKLTGWVSYTLSRSTREAHPLGGAGRVTDVPSEFDRPHVLNVVGAYDLGLGWRIGARLFYYSGRPYSNRIEGVAVPPYNSLRLPDYVRLDARLEKRWPTKTGYVSFVAEGLNVTASREVLDVKCTPTTSPTLQYDHCEPDTGNAIPVIIPIIGFEGAF